MRAVEPTRTAARTRVWPDDAGTGESGLVHHALDRAALHRPHAPALSDPEGTWTFAELRRAALGMACRLAYRGVAPRDRVVVRLPNSRLAAAVLYACFYRGAVAVPVHPKVKPFHLTSILRSADPALVVGAAAELATLRSSGAREAVGVDALWDEARMADASHGLPAGVRGDDLALILFTSGSTAAPNGVRCPHRAVHFVTGAIAERLAYRPDDVVMSWLPFSFDYGLYQLFLCVGTACELLVGSDERGHATLVSTLRARGVTVVPVVPASASGLVKLAARNPAPCRVRLFTNTGASLDPPLAQALRHQFPGAEVVPMYGLTECKRVSIGEPDEDLVRPWSMGRPLPGTTAYPADAHGRIVPPGTVGQIIVRGPHVMDGYWRAPELTAARFRTDPGTGEPVLLTGDFGYRDETGRLYFTGRRDDVFKRLGFRVSTVEIEAAAHEVAGVDSAVALPPDGDHDAVLVVCGTVDPHQVLRGLADRLEPAKVPPRCLVLDELPLGVHGKVDRRALAAQVRGSL